MSALPNTDPALTAALGYAARGWRVVPIKAGGKHPPMREWQKNATNDTDTIRALWTGLYRGCGVGVATGTASGVWVLDVDDWDALVALESEHGPLPPTYTVVTGSGGIHHYFAMPAGQTITNANRLPKGIDVRGDALGLVHASVEYLDHMRGYRSQTKYLKRTVLQPEELKARAVRQAREACLALA